MMPAGRRRKPPSRVAVFFSLLVVTLASALTVFTLFIGPPLENNVLTTWRCTVTSAEPRQSNGGFKGSSSLPSVRLHTTECGDVVLQWGITFDNSARVAADFLPGVYDFQVGWVSAHLMPLLPNGLPAVKSYEPVSESPGLP